MSSSEKVAANSRALAREMRRRRLAAGLSMNQLATLSGLSQPMIGFIEGGRCSPTAASLFRIAAALNCSLSEIFAAVEAAQSQQ